MRRFSPSRSGDARWAFTFTDLLVTLAVLSVSAALGATALVAGREQSRQALCIRNLQQINRAVLSFTTDHKEALPTVLPGDSRNLWWFYKEQVKSYVGLTGDSSAMDQVFACPNDRGYSEPGPFHRNGRFDFNSYVYNGVTLPGAPCVAGLLLPDIKQPDRTLLVMEWTAHAPLSWHKSRTGRKNMPFYRDAESVVGFIDGHVKLTRIYYDGYNAAYTQDPIAGYDYRYSAN